MSRGTRLFIYLIGLLVPQLALAQKQSEHALSLLGGITAPESLSDRGKQYYQLRAAAYAQTGNALEAAELGGALAQIERRDSSG